MFTSFVLEKDIKKIEKIAKLIFQLTLILLYNHTGSYKKGGKRMKKLVSAIALGVLVTSGSLFSVSSASAAENVEVSQEDLAAVKSNFVDLGIDENTIEKLLERFKNGQEIDADVLDVGQAVSKHTVREGDVSTTTYTFADGSRSQTEEEKLTLNELPSGLKPVSTNSGGFSTMSISGGKCTSGSGYSSCSGRKVSYRTGTYGYSFYASYSLANGAYDKITSAGKWNVWTAGGTVTNPKMRTIRANETGNNKAEARLSAVLNLGNSAGSLTRSLSLIVGSDKAYSRWNSYY